MIKLKPTTFCNPINISYQYQNGYNSRESADPCVIIYRGEYYLFASCGTGYWWSADMIEWNFVYSKLADIQCYAPGVCVIDDALYLTNNDCGIYKTTNPKEDEWSYIGKPLTWYDPAFLVDDDGRVYCYYGCSSTLPIYVVELDTKNDMRVINGPVELFNSNREVHGFEVSGNSNENYEGDCWLEGPWMTKHDGIYYLQYAAPGSEYATYADGCYTSNNPLGPFTYCDNSPISYKATGFVKGAGHGGTFKDLQGNYWRIDTTNISVNHKFERRVLIYRAKFKDGRLYTDLSFGDYPMYGPKDGTFEKSRPEWNLLSLNTTSEASSSLTGYESNLAFNEDFRTWWSAETGNAGEWLKTDLGGICQLNAIQINFADQDITDSIGGRDNVYRHRYLVEISTDGETWITLIDRQNAIATPNMAEDTTHDYFELETDIQLRYIRISNCGYIPAGGRFAISGLRLFGQGEKNPPEAVKDFTISRSATDDRMVSISWLPSEGSQAYLIRFGTQRDALFTCYQVFDNEKAVIRCLNAGTNYYFTVDAYNSGGVTRGTEIKSISSAQIKP